MTITLYSKPNCVQCTATKSALDRKGLTHTTVDVSQDIDAYNFVSDLGYRQVPIVVAGNEHWAGFRPGLINGLVVS